MGPYQPSLVAGHRPRPRGSRGLAVALSALLGLSGVQCVQDFVSAPTKPEYEFGVTQDSVNLAIGDTVAPFTGTLTADGVSVPFRLGIYADPNGIVEVLPDARLVVLRRGRTVLRLRPFSTQLTDTTLFDTAVVRGVVPVVALTGAGSEDTLTSLGQTLTLQAEARTSRGAPIPGVQLRWRQVAPSSAVSLVDSNAGLVRAELNGTGQFVALVDNATSQPRSVRVRQRATRLITTDTLRFGAIGQSRQVVDSIRDARANPVAGAAVTAWRSLNAGIATVNATGLVTAVSGDCAPQPSCVTGIVARHTNVFGDSLLDTTTVIVTQARLARVSADSQDAVAGREVQLEVRLTDGAGNPLSYSGVALAFQVNPGAGTLSATGDTTDAQGRARVTLTLASSLGVSRVTVSGGGLAGGAVEFVLRRRPTAPKDLVIIAGGNQTDTVGQTLPTGLTLAVRDSFLNRVQGVQVRFVVTAGGGKLFDMQDTAYAVSDSSGQVAVPLRLGTTAGVNTVEASAQGVSGTVTFTATGVPGAPAALRFSVEPTQIVAGATFSPVVGVEVVDEYGNLSPGATAPIGLSLLPGSG
ncbi:MAG TPA: hypothetical protein VNL98_00700, partial [Gemmatimonadales bacterium]|nr:hypothetical protein [Gemmatimonadales bacterium]